MLAFSASHKMENSTGSKTFNRDISSTRKPRIFSSFSSGEEITIMSTSLDPNGYNVGVKKTIVSSLEDRPYSMSAENKVEAVPAQWSLSAADDGSADILSVFPAPGQTAPSFTTLPHVVFRDSELPWAYRANLDPVVPWFALIIFTRDELELEPQEQSSFFGHVEGKINDTFGWDISVADLGSINDPTLVNLIPNPDKDDETETSIITIPGGLFKGLFATNSDSDGQEVFDVSPFRFMSHVRKNDDGDALASSVVISHRLGPDDIKNPTPVFAHLVSLQGIHGQSVNSLDGKERVIITSLYSWSYNALPPNAAGLGTNMSLSMLGSGQLSSNNGKGAAVAKRLNEGYTLVRHRIQTGEETAAMYRGPLAPRRVPYPLNKDIAKFDGDLRIYDPDLNLVDISYDSAWQLGKSLALKDGKFTIALTRLRDELQSQRGKAELSGESTSYGSRHDVIAGLSGLMERLGASGVPTRSRPLMPKKTDSAIVEEWVFNRLLLNGIPAHYLISDTSHLPSESLRFFHIDKNWTDVLVDGALSLANYNFSQSDKDNLRTATREALDKRQVPSYGLFLRSQVLASFPRLECQVQGSDPPKVEVLAQRKLADDTMLVLLDCQPRGSVSLIFTPVGQPTFTAAAEFLPVDGNRAIPEVEIVNRTNGNRVRYPRDELFNWETRTLKIKNYMGMVQGERPESDSEPTSAGLALQLEGPGYTITVNTEEVENAANQEKNSSIKAFTFNKDEIFFTGRGTTL
ncbi:uncharacterized protein B0J16DRAFT_336489 [Fusarium flagelliforme]|uniref:uncharacterized protein n=1 Tax=Fusarium flagelliforme TaxID=2675880 RepID=UPI001E8D4E4E|nr:uncharacterized protein B0J16DRAFT_336489 [Fusarium flagelliforme]KAH7188134.1 hypothetical protein B0J16DRAFT_336489 [Fusarium flagelliforme]